jgi:hypothetical protein
MPDPRAIKQEGRPISMSYKQDGDATSGSGLAENHRISYHILQCALATIIVSLYSRNLFSVMVRAAVGFSS